jgi:hypothetical protein
MSRKSLGPPLPGIDDEMTDELNNRIVEECSHPNSPNVSELALTSPDNSWSRPGTPHPDTAEFAFAMFFGVSPLPASSGITWQEAS